MKTAEIYLHNYSASRKVSSYDQDLKVHMEKQK